MSEVAPAPAPQGRSRLGWRVALGALVLSAIIAAYPGKTTVVDYGADPTGVGDSTAAIRAAIAQTAHSFTPNSIIFPPGTYRWTDTIVATGMAWNCQGGGGDSATLIFDDASGTKDGITVGNGIFEMSGCWYDRKQNGTAGALIHLTDSFYVSVHDNNFTGPHAFNDIVVDSATHEPNTISVRDNVGTNFINDFLFLNSQNASFPVYTLYAVGNKLASGGHAHYELAGYGQINITGDFATGPATYCIYIHTANDQPINTLSYIRGLDCDSGQTVRVENFNGIHFVGNDIRGPVVMTLDQGVEFMSNYFDCGSNTCPITLAGITGFDWAANVITGQNSPITINPSGSTPSTDLNFTGGSWKYGTGAFLNFLGTPVADNVTITGVTLTGTEVAAAFTSTPTHYFNLGPTSGASNALSFSSCSGTGATGACSVAAGSTNESGKIIMTTAGGSEASTGIVHMTYAGAPAVIGPTGSDCTVTPEDGTGAWTLPVSWKLDTALTNGAMGFVWLNGGSTALTDAKTYKWDYKCRGR